MTPATPSIIKRATRRWTFRCPHYSVAKRQQFSCFLRTATLSLKFEKVIPEGCICFFPVLYPSNNVTAVREGTSSSRGVCVCVFFFFFRLGAMWDKHMAPCSGRFPFGMLFTWNPASVASWKERIEAFLNFVQIWAYSYSTVYHYVLSIVTVYNHTPGDNIWGST